jgi:uncharacterized protein (DUF305 family)
MPILDRPRRALLLGAFAALVALLIGYGAGLLTPSLRAPGDNSPEAGFARDMSTHHAQAVDMALIAYPKMTDDEELHQTAYDIALGQENQIGIMQTWLKQWHLEPTGSRPRMAWMPDGASLTSDGLMPGMATSAQVDQLTAATGKTAEILFCQLMLRHHLGGIHMVDGILALTHNQQVIDLATTMKANQQNEVNILKGKLADLGAQPLGS